jgi:hypothetical protein
MAEDETEELHGPKGQETILKERIRSRMADLKLTGNAVAVAAGLKCRKTINRFLREGQTMRDDTLEKVAKALKTHPAYLLGYSDVVEAPAQRGEAGTSSSGMPVPALVQGGDHKQGCSRSEELARCQFAADVVATVLMDDCRDVVDRCRLASDILVKALMGGSGEQALEDRTSRP